MTVPGRLSIIRHLVVMGVFDLLLEPKLLKVLKINKAGMKLLPTALLLLEIKASAGNDLLGSKGDINPRVLGPILHATRLPESRDKLLDAFLIQATEGMWGIVTLLVYDCINDIIGHTQGSKHPGNESSSSGSIMCIMLLHPQSTEVPFCSSLLAC